MRFLLISFVYLRRILSLDLEIETSHVTLVSCKVSSCLISILRYTGNTNYKPLHLRYQVTYRTWWNLDGKHAKFFLIVAENFLIFCVKWKLRNRLTYIFAYHDWEQVAVLEGSTHVIHFSGRFNLCLSVTVQKS